LRWFRASFAGATCAWALDASAQLNYAPRQMPGIVAQPTPWSQVVARTTGRTAADLYIDGKLICRLPCQATIPSGLHVVSGRGPAGVSAEQRIYFAPGRAVPVLLDVIPQQSVLRISSDFPGSLIYVDGVFVGHSNWQGAVAPGPHRLQLRRPTGEQVQQDVVLAAGMTYDIRDKAPRHPSVPPPAAAVPSHQQRHGAPPSPEPRSAHGMTGRDDGPPNGTSPGMPAPGTDATERADRFRGLTGALFVPVMLGGASTNDYGDHCPATPFGGYCTVGGPRGAAIAGRIGYAHDWIAPELTLALSVDLSSGGMHLPADAKLEGDVDGILTQIAGQTKFLRVGMLGGLGVRVASEGRSSRFTLSGSFGLVKRHVYVLPDSFFGQRPSYTAKSLFFDAGILLGDTPGAKIYLGLFAWFEFVPSLVIDRDVTKLNLDPELVPASLRRIKPYNGTQLMFGPLIGVSFGH